MDPLDQDALKRLAGNYIWWKTSDEAVAMPARVAAQVMNVGDYDDVQTLVKQVGDQYLRDVLIGMIKYFKPQMDILPYAQRIGRRGIMTAAPSLNRRRI